ncbi:MAG: ParM/StbA family protein [Candidatus Methanomethylicaceae archaeon]
MTANAAGIDVGHSHVKVVRDAGVAVAKTCVWPVRESDDIQLLKKHQDAIVNLNGEAFWVGDIAVIQSCGEAPHLLEDDWVRHPHYAVLMKYGLALAQRMNKDGRNIDAVGLGLPASAFSRDRKDVKELAHNLFGKEVTHIYVIPQPYAAYLGYLWLPSGQVNENAKKQRQIGVIDVGFGTTDVGLVQEGVWASSAAHSTEGISRVASAIMRFIREKCGVSIGLQQADEALRKGLLPIKGHPVDLREVIQREANVLAGMIYDAFRISLGRHAETLDAILLVGGGASVVEPHLRKRYPHLVMPSMAQFAIARGLCHYARLSQS